MRRNLRGVRTGGGGHLRRVVGGNLEIAGLGQQL
jgi:hypothetical protein